AAACGFVLGAAAAALVAFAVGWLIPDARDASATADLPPQFTWLQDGHLREKSQLLSEMDAVFDRQVAWLLETGARVKIGVAERARASSAKAVAVRIVVQRRRPGESDWSLLWAADVVARNEEVVRLEPDA